jgi:D-isomer specific 2-hydroxyacid dehydrogenase, NAD binding domain
LSTLTFADIHIETHAARVYFRAAPRNRNMPTSGLHTVSDRPPSYVFEGMRALLADQPFRGALLLQGIAGGRVRRLLPFDAVCVMRERTTWTGARLVSKEELLREAAVVSIHLVLSRRTTGLIGAPELSRMKPSARLINTSRGPIVVEAALVSALGSRQIAGAAVDVFDSEPLPLEHPYRRIAHLLATPHIGYVSRNSFKLFYRDTVANIVAWLDARALLQADDELS